VKFLRRNRQPASYHHHNARQILLGIHVEGNHTMTRTSKLAGMTLATLAAALVASTAMAERGPGRDGARLQAPFAAFDFAAVDANKDGKVTPEEIDAFRAAEIKAADTDGDGLMSAAELSAIHLKRMEGRANDMAQKMIERMDSDKDGKLSTAEMLARKAPKSMFERIDTDNDGALSEAEIAAAKDRMADRRGGKNRRGGERRGHANN
jgi:hypothetical protein